jgi:dihydroorotate dehydrogenase electron transfer subunit
MHSFSALIDALRLEPPGSVRARLIPRTPLRLLPGQALLAFAPLTGGARRSTVFPCAIHDQSFVVPVPPGERWGVGDEIDVIGPLGPGFRPPARCRKWLLAAPGRSAERLEPLISLAAARSVEIALVSNPLPPSLPTSVEVNPSLKDAVRWADYMAWDIDEGGDLHRQLGRNRSACEVLVAPPMPCGSGACQACAVAARRGWKLACIDGPVFSAGDLRPSS